MSKAIITGATGFIGHALVEKLCSYGWEVAIISRPESDLSSISNIINKVKVFNFKGSTKQLIEIFHEFRPDVVFHLASLFLASHTESDVIPLLNSNVLLGTQLLEAMAFIGCKRIINTGTSWQHYQSAQYRPVNLYAATKQAFEDILAFYQERFELSAITLKLFDTYGPKDRRRKLVNILVDSAVSGEELELSPGDQVIDISHIDDVVEDFIASAYYLLKSNYPENLKFFVSGERFTVKQLVTEIENALGVKANVVFGARPYRDREVMNPVECNGKYKIFSREQRRIPFRVGILDLVNDSATINSK